MRDEHSLKINAVCGCIRREVLRYLHDPIQTIFNEIFSALLMLFAFYFLRPGQQDILIIGIIVYINFGVIFSNMKMTIFVGKMDNSIYYQISSDVPRTTLYLIYVATSIFRALLISFSLLAIVCFFVKPYNTYALGPLCFWLVVTDVAFANFAVLLTLFIKSWNGFGAIDSYIVMPLLFLSGCFFGGITLPFKMEQIIHCNPIFHFFNCGVYFCTNKIIYTPSISLLICTLLLCISTVLCLHVFKNGYGILK